MLESISIENPIRSKSTSNKPAGRIDPKREVLNTVGRLTTRQHKRFFSLCHYFANKETSTKNESRHLGQNEMAELKGKSGPPGNMNAFKYVRIFRHLGITAERHISAVERF